MAREHLLVGEEESIHSNQIVLETKKDIYKNWWYYHKGHLLIIAISAAVVVSFIVSMVNKVTPDYQIGLITSVTWTEEMMDDLSEYIGRYGDDRNGDGDVVVQINQYSFSDSDTADPNMLQASMVRFSADSTNADSIIFLHDEKGFDFFADDTLGGYFNYNDGSPMPEKAQDFENAMVDWSEVTALSNYSAPDLTDSMTPLTGDRIDEILSKYRVSLRSQSPTITKKEERMEYYQDSMELFNRMMNDEKINIAE